MVHWISWTSGAVFHWFKWISSALDQLDQWCSGSLVQVVQRFIRSVGSVVQCFIGALAYVVVLLQWGRSQVRPSVGACTILKKNDQRDSSYGYCFKIKGRHNH